MKFKMESLGDSIESTGLTMEKILSNLEYPVPLILIGKSKIVRYNPKKHNLMKGQVSDIRESNLCEIYTGLSTFVMRKDDYSKVVPVKKKDVTKIILNGKAFTIERNLSPLEFIKIRL